MKEKLERLETIPSDPGGVGVGFSAGVDGTFLPEVCRDVLGDKRLAVSGVSGRTRQAVHDPRRGCNVGAQCSLGPLWAGCFEVFATLSFCVWGRAVDSGAMFVQVLRRAKDASEEVLLLQMLALEKK